MNKPQISVIVPCYNQAQYLDECLQSVLDQAYRDWECIVVNDGSPDNTEEIALKWTEKDVRFIYLFKENGGLSSARNAGIDKAKGEWILPLDADDKIGSQYLELAEREFSKNPTIVYCEGEYFGEKSGKIDLKTFSSEALLTENLLSCTSFFQKKDWIRVRGYDENLIYGLEDWEFWIAIVDKERPIIKISETCFFYRIKNESMVRTLQGNRFSLMINYITTKHQNKYINHFGDYWSLLKSNERYIQESLKFKNSVRYRFIDKLLRLFGK